LANQTGRPIAPARKLVAAVMGTIAFFVMALGLGMSSWGVVIFGVILLALSIALGMVNVVRRGARAWITGTAEVRAISPRPTSAVTFGRAQIQAVVVAPGLATAEVTIHETKVPVAKWPMPGDTLPIEVDVDDPRRVRIQWSEAQPRERGDDPPPPPSRSPYDEENPGDDATADELLGDFEPPPWTTRDQDWGLGPDEPPPPPPPVRFDDDTVVVHETPEGKVVEGELVGHDAGQQPLPRRAGSAATAGGTAAAAAAGAAAGGSARPAGRRPSPHPRGSGTATATAEPETARYTDSWSPPTEAPPPPPSASPPTAAPPPAASPSSASPSSGSPSSGSPAASEGPAAASTMTEEAPAPAPAETPQQRPPHPDETDKTGIGLDDDDDIPPWERRTEPIPMSAAAAPTPTSAPPTAPPPMTPPPTAPAPSSPLREPEDDVDIPLAPASSSRPLREPEDDIDIPLAPASSSPPLREPEDNIDIPLDPDPDPAPEATPAAAEAVEEDLVAPPANTRFVSNGAHEAEVPTEQLPPVAPKPLHSSNTVAAAVGAVAGAAVAAVKKRLTKHDEPATDDPDRTGEVITAYPSARPGPAGSIHGVGVTILVTDLARSITFYHDTLGFHAIDQGESSAVLASGDTRLVLRTVHELTPDTAALMNLNLEVGDVQAVYEDLRAKGVSFVHPPQPVNRGDRLELWSATFRDPDAHSIAITQWRAVRDQ
jgi:catechol 2,3-dioxygenase-like lactoylglutathione lyase family enzyme